jgi:hypothetical protein
MHASNSGEISATVAFTASSASSIRSSGTSSNGFPVKSFQFAELRLVQLQVANDGAINGALRLAPTRETDLPTSTAGSTPNSNSATTVWRRASFSLSVAITLATPEACWPMAQQMHTVLPFFWLSMVSRARFHEFGAVQIYFLSPSLFSL